MKMNISMEFLKPLTGTLRKYTALLPSIIITVVAILLSLPTMLVGNKVKAKMDASAKLAKSVQSLSKKVPSKDEPLQIQIYMDKLEKEADEIKRLAIQSSQRDLVTYDYVIFPTPQDQSSQIFTIFGDKYRSAIKKLIEKMNAMDAPSDDEIRAKIGSGGNQYSGYGGAKTVNTENPMVDALCLVRAQEVSVYANPSAFSWYEYWEKYEFSDKDSALEDCWDSQVSLWIYEDVVDTIVKMNGTAGEVLSSPVKRLLGVSFTGPVTIKSQNRTTYAYYDTSMGFRDIPNYITPILPSNFFLDDSPTARISNEDIDVIHFAVSVLVDSRFVLGFMEELCSEKSHIFYPEFDPQKGQPIQARHNQITILQTDLKVVDKTDPDHELYRYGKGGVVRLDLICEYQFNRMGYDKIKPDPIKKRLNQLEEAELPAGPQGGNMPPGGRFF